MDRERIYPLRRLVNYSRLVKITRKPLLSGTRRLPVPPLCNGLKMVTNARFSMERAALCIHAFALPSRDSRLSPLGLDYVNVPRLTRGGIGSGV